MSRALVASFLLVTTSVLVSCDVPYTVELPQTDPKLVLNLITEDSVGWRAQLSRSKGVLDLPPFPAIPNAVVRVYEGGNLLEQLEFVDNADLDDYYAGKVSSPVPGKTYFLEAIASAMPTITSTYVHPAAVLVEDFEVDLLGSQSSSNSQRMKFRITFTDPQGSNYYSIGIRQKTEDSPFPSAGRDLTLFYSNPAYEENKRVFRRSIALDDALFEDTKVTLEFEAILSYQTGGSLEDLSYFTVTLQNISEDLFNYYKTFYLQELTRGDPFAQPAIVTSNIENGLGIVGGFTVTDKTIRYE